MMNVINKITNLFESQNNSITESNQIPQSIEDFVALQMTAPVQKVGAMSILPLQANDCEGKWTSPYSGLKFAGVQGYGTVTFHNDSDGIAILPMHMGYIQQGAQNHAISAAALLAKGESRQFKNARCVQAAQGGYLKTQEQWFFILPLKLREEMLNLRKEIGCGHMWNAIGRLGKTYGQSGRGHLDDVICKYRAELNVYGKQFEQTSNQRGALFFLDDQLVGIEIAPSKAYFSDIWNSLVCFCYGTAAHTLKRKTDTSNEIIQREKNLEQVRKNLIRRRDQYTVSLFDHLKSINWKIKSIDEEESLMDLRLNTVHTDKFYGQIIQRNKELIYASLFRKGIGV